MRTPSDNTLHIMAACAALLTMCRAAIVQAGPLDYLTLMPISDGIAATDDRGWANSHINAVSFKTQALTTVGDYQFTSYYGADGKLIVGRRNLATNPGTWDLLRTQFTSFNINDAHNTSSMAIDGDGYLHIAWGVHGNPLPYTRSTTSVLNDNPFTLVGATVGNSGSISGVLPFQSSGTTYPEFFNAPGGDLLMTYRLGNSGNGEWQLSRWNNTTDTWGAVHAAQGSGNTGPQPWIDNDYSGDSLPNANAYHNNLVFDSTGRLHVTWTWRTGGDSTSGFTDYQSNHNIMYAYSDDQGVDWRRADGALYQRNGVHDIDENNALPVVLIPEGSSHINANSSAVGPNDHFYTATYWAPLAGEGNHLRQVMLVEYDGLEWKTHQVGERNSEFGNNRIPESQLRNYPLRRPMVMTDEEDRVFIIFGDYQRGGGVSLAYSESASRNDWTLIDLTTESLGTWSPTYDRSRWANDGVLSLYYQPMGLGQTAANVSVLEWDARAYFASDPQPPPVPRPPVVVYNEAFNSATVPINWFAQNGSAGTATLAVVNDASGIGTGNALSITAATRQGTIGKIDEVQFVNVGDKIELSFDVRLAQFPNNAGGFRFGLYHDYDGLALSSGYRVLVGTGTSSPSTDVQADGGDTVDGDIAFGVNRENPPGFQSSITGITDNDSHSFLLRLTRTAEGVLISVLQDGMSSLIAPVLHVPGTGAGSATPLQLRFNEIVFTTNGGFTALIDNVLVEYFSSIPLVAGDFDGDGDVDGADFVAWQTNFPTSSGATLEMGDADGDGDVDGADFVVWQTNFPTTGGAPGTMVNEPLSASLLVLGGAVLLRRNRRTIAGHIV